MLDWLRASCTILGTNRTNLCLSILNLNLEARTPDARVVKFMRDQVAPFQRPADPTFAKPPGGAPAGGDPILPAGTIAAPTGKKEYSFLETAKIQAACGIKDAHWENDLPTLYIRMLEEGWTNTQVKALLEDPFHPNDIFNLFSVHLRVTNNVTKCIYG
jgi:hypothetical protein